MPDPRFVLVAEDNDDFRSQIVSLLGPLGLSCLPAAHGGEAIAILRDASQALHLVVTDMEMPVRNGWDVIRAARQHRGEALPIIMQTGQAQYAHVWRLARELDVVLIDKLELAHRLVPAACDALGLPRTPPPP